MHESLELGRRPCFVVSTGRCGSQMIARVLALHPEIGAFHEPPPLLNTTAYLRWSNRRGADDVHQRLRRSRDSLVEQVDGNRLVYLESSHFLSHLVPELRERYHARFVHLYRDGRHFTRSGLERGWYVSDGPLHRARTWLRRATNLPLGGSYTDHRLDPPASLDSRLERVAWLWTEINRIILSELERLPPEDVLSVRLEEFDVDCLRRILAFLGKTGDERLLEEMQSVAASRPNSEEYDSAPPPQEWSAEEIAEFREVAGDMMKRLSYAGG